MKPADQPWFQFDTYITYFLNQGEILFDLDGKTKVSLTDGLKIEIIE